ncbi:PIN domain-containing protein [Litoribacter populi]|uniref:PIN domain-containing protein n=1 Tax=Litoribacter populi TaxID=2598460 RepID=UPI00118042C4|nr:PIN domain-containing protein [Litoribacter populi]
MRIAVTDACIFIDLIELDLISEFFQLDIELHTTVEVINELFPEQKQVLGAYQAVNKLVVHNFQEGDFARMEEISFPRGLSSEDRSVIFMAMNLKNAIVLSSDRLVRKFAESCSLEYHGIFWIFDLLISEECLSKAQAIVSLQKLVTINGMYSGDKMKKEIQNRIRQWDKIV